MFRQTIEETFVGTSEPVTLHHSLSYYGPLAPDASTTSIERYYALLDQYVDSNVGQSVNIKLSANITAGLVLPSWSASMKVTGGEITADTMTLTVTDDTFMGGMELGALIQIHFSFDYRFWHPRFLWKAGYWEDWHQFEKSLDFDLIPMGVDTIVTLAGLIPKFKFLFQLLPKSLLDHLQDAENGIVDGNGLFINASIPFKWDLISIGRSVAEAGVEVASLGLTPAGAALVTLLVELAEFAVSLLDKLKVVQIAFGPQMDVVFPVRVTITGLVAGYEADREAVVFDEVSFSGNTVTGRIAGGAAIADTAPPFERIGLRFKHSPELLTTDVGVWGHFALFWIFGASPCWDLHLTEILEDELGFDLGLANFHSSMSNSIGAGGQETTTGKVPDSVVVTFI